MLEWAWGAAPWAGGGVIASVTAMLMWCLGRKSRNAATARDLAAAKESQVKTNGDLWDQVTHLQNQIQSMRDLRDAEVLAARTLHDAEITALKTLHAAEMEAMRKINVELERQTEIWKTERADILRRLAACEQNRPVVAEVTT